MLMDTHTEKLLFAKSQREQFVKNYTDVKLVLLYRIILETLYDLKKNFLLASDHCPDTSRRIPQTEIERRNEYVRD